MTLLSFSRAAQIALACAPIGCVRYLPPAPTPPPVVPPVNAQPPAPNTARVVVDVVDGPTAVQRVQMAPQPQTDAQGQTTFRFVETPALLCAATPCVADVPPGNVLLGFPVIGNPGATEVELVHVGPDPSVYRRALSTYDGDTGAERVLGIIATAIGGTSMMAGTAMLPIGLAKDNHGLTVAGGITLGGGTLLTVIGILMMRHDAPTYRPGAANHFPLR